MKSLIEFVSQSITISLVISPLKSATFIYCLLLTLVITFSVEKHLLNLGLGAGAGAANKLWVLDLSYNNLTGNIPHTYSSIKYINLSYNSLEGPIPHGYDVYHTFDTLIGNRNLCGVSCISLLALQFQHKTNQLQLE
jgi:hypothetical protein